LDNEVLYDKFDDLDEVVLNSDDNIIIISTEPPFSIRNVENLEKEYLE
jgi:hypothetical protein